MMRTSGDWLSPAEAPLILLFSIHVITGRRNAAYNECDREGEGEGERERERERERNTFMVQGLVSIFRCNSYMYTKCRCLNYTYYRWEHIGSQQKGA